MVFSALKTQVPHQAKRGLVYPKKLVFKGKGRKIHIHQRASKVVVGDPFAQYWCIDFGLLPLALIPSPRFQTLLLGPDTRSQLQPANLTKTCDLACRQVLEPEPRLKSHMPQALKP